VTTDNLSPIYLLNDKSAFVFYSNLTGKTYTFSYQRCIDALLLQLSQEAIDTLLFEQNYKILIQKSGLLRELEQ